MMDLMKVAANLVMKWPSKEVIVSIDILLH